MDIMDILSTDATKVLTGCTSKKRLFHEIGDLAAKCFELDADVVIDALSERENLGPTGVGRGVALPHARLDGIDRARGIFLMLEKPMDFEAVDRQPVDLIFAILAPTNAGVDHLKALALVSRTLRNAEACAKLRANPDETTLHMILTSETTNQAA